MPTPGLRPAAQGTLMNLYPFGVSSAIIDLSLFFFTHISVMANMSMSWSVTNSLMVKVLFLTDWALSTATERVFFLMCSYDCVVWKRELSWTDHYGKVICTLACWGYMFWLLHSHISLDLMVRLFTQQVQCLLKYVCVYGSYRLCTQAVIRLSPLASSFNRK